MGFQTLRTSGEKIVDGAGSGAVLPVGICGPQGASKVGDEVEDAREIRERSRDGRARQ